MILQESLKEPLYGLSVAPLLQEYIHHLAILVNGSPKIMLLPADLHEVVRPIAIGIDPISDFQVGKHANSGKTLHPASFE